jgi:hypothetical protein
MRRGGRLGTVRLAGLDRNVQSRRTGRYRSDGGITGHSGSLQQPHCQGALVLLKLSGE